MSKSTVKISENFHSIVVTKTLGPKRTFKVRFSYNGVSTTGKNINDAEFKQLTAVTRAVHQSLGKTANYGEVSKAIALALEDAI